MRTMFVPTFEATRITIDLLDKYRGEESIEDALKPNYSYLPPEDFLQEHFKENNYSDELQDVVTEFFFRVLKHRKYLEIIIKKYCTSKTSWAQKDADFALCLVYFYLLVIELNEMTRSKIEDLLISTKEKKILSLLTFLKRPDMLTTLYEWGCQIWDVEHVKSILQNVIKKTLFEEVYKTIVDHMQNSKRSQVKQLTKPVGPKCLNRHRKFVPPPPTYCPEPHITRIPIMIKASKMPSSTYARPIQIEMLEKARLKHKEQAKKLLEESQKYAFRCANTEKSKKFRELVEKIEKEKFGVPVKKRTLKRVKTKEVQYPKKTAAVILREGARILKLEQEEIKRFEDLANGGFNSDLITEWEEEIREENFKKHLEDIERKHLEGLLTYEEAVLSKLKCLKRKKECADEVRKEKEIWLKKLEAWRCEEQMRIQESVEKGKALEKGAKEAVETVKEEKHKMALETIEESRALKERWLKEKEEDLKRKVQLIKEIKALQTFGSVIRKQTDVTETTNLGAMSIVELKERLFLLKIEVQEELEKRRSEIKMKRKCRKEIIEGYQELIESHQRMVKEGKEKTDNESLKKEKKEILRSSSIESLRRKFYEKRKQRMREKTFLF